MADATAAALAAARELLAADLQELGAALRLGLEAHGPASEAQEFISRWELHSRALLDAVDSTESGLEGAAATVAAEFLHPVLHPLLNGASASVHPGLSAQALVTAKSTLLCCSFEGSTCFVGPLAFSVLDVFLNEQLDPQTRSAAAELLICVLGVSDCVASLLAAPWPDADGIVGALIAAAKRRGQLQQDNAFAALAALVKADAATAERATSPEAGLLPIAVERIQSVAADGAKSLAGRSFFGPLRLLWALTSAAPCRARGRVMVSPGVAGAAADLLMALSAAERAAQADGQQAACQHAEVASQSLAVLSNLMSADRFTYVRAFDALTRSGALPRVLALLRSPSKAVRSAASFCIARFADEEIGRVALFKVPGVASELAGALRRAYEDGDDPTQTQSYAAFVLSLLLQRSEGRRVGAALARAAAAEGSASSLLGALTGMIEASVPDRGDGAAGHTEAQWTMCYTGVVVLNGIASASTAPEQLRALRRVPLLAEACVGALRYWLTADGDHNMSSILNLVFVVSVMAGFDSKQVGRRGAPPAAATADTAAARAELRAAPGLGAALQGFFDRPPAANAEFATIAAFPAKWLLSLPELKAPAAAGGRSAAAQPLVPEAGGSSSSSSRADGSGPSSSGGGGDGGGSGSAAGSSSGAEAAARPRACGECGKSATAEAPLLRCVGCKAQFYCGEACALRHWPSHRAACKAARRVCQPTGAACEAARAARKAARKAAAQRS
ncbi:hypothetical protein Rsub_10333 [Raphidocelis subcapitata]|uniref:MYND-type domain-containing protein n=1 Tax=Raphidocelis subcapitata TaxID=307507 RepID=A0A2V0PBC5_9CHLO|nr:hypothetical protein Rsub_10333 [Raphidocelis subcapitata]|eukprot:GBF97146.1 hypothetical protein Rsub_10333 [Raphidocelis subcapitata]